MSEKNAAAVELGRRGGSKNSAAQNAARARNGRLGGRPRKAKDMAFHKCDDPRCDMCGNSYRWKCNACGTTYNSEAQAAGCPCPGHTHARTKVIEI